MDEAGDQKVGRVLCGLKTKELTFSSLPPRFKDAKTIEFNKIIPYYDTLPVNIQEVVPLLTASLIYHLEKLVQDLPQTHLLFMSRFWTETYRTEIANEILPPCLYHCEVTGMEATGLPDHYNILHTLTNKIDDMKTVVEETIKGSNSLNSIQSRSSSNNVN